MHDVDHTQLGSAWSRIVAYEWKEPSYFEESEQFREKKVKLQMMLVVNFRKGCAEQLADL